MPKVSVLVAAFGVERYIVRTLQSLQAQTMTDLEVIVVDDASRDRTAEIVEGVAAADPRVRLVRHERNQGPSAARNTALARATGDWIAIVDADDWIAPQRFERLLTEAERAGAEMVADDVLRIWDGEEVPFGNIVLDRKAPVGLVGLDEFIDHDQPGMDGWGILQPLIRRDFLEKHGIRYRVGLDRIEDFLLFVDCFAAGGRLVLLTEGMYYYRQRRGSHRVTSMSVVQALELALYGNQLARQSLASSTDAAVLRALDRREAAITRTLRYRRIAEPIRHGDLASGLRQLMRDPFVASAIIMRGCDVVYRWLIAHWRQVGAGGAHLTAWW